MTFLGLAALVCCAAWRTCSPTRRCCCQCQGSEPRQAWTRPAHTKAQCNRKGCVEVGDAFKRLFFFLLYFIFHFFSAFFLPLHLLSFYYFFFLTGFTCRRCLAAIVVVAVDFVARHVHASHTHTHTEWKNGTHSSIMALSVAHRATSIIRSVVCLKTDTIT